MIRCLTIAATTLSLALTPIAASAQSYGASSGNVNAYPYYGGQPQTEVPWGQILGGLAILGALGLALDNANDDDDDDNDKKKKTSSSKKNHGKKSAGIVQRGDHANRGHGHGGHRPGHIRRNGVAAAPQITLPRECVRRVRFGQTTRSLVGSDCLKRRGFAVNRLPDACESDVHAYGRKRAVFSAGCLQNRGYRLVYID